MNSMKQSFVKFSKVLASLKKCSCPGKALALCDWLAFLNGVLGRVDCAHMDLQFEFVVILIEYNF